MAEIKIISCTGHRPSKLNKEYDYKGPCSTYLISQLTDFLVAEKPDKCISGMALGADTLFALVALQLGIPLEAAIPFKGQEKKWPYQSQQLYNKILDNPLTTKRIISPGGYSIESMHKRDRYMVDECDKIVAIYNGTKGGTHYTVQYAISEAVDIKYIHPDGWKEKAPQQNGLFD